MIPIDPDSLQIAQSIQLAVAPVFLLSAVGIVITVLTNRLARLVDRARRLEETAAAGGPDLRDRHEQLRVLGRRARLVNRAITMSVVCALLVSFVVVAIFVNQLVKIDLTTLVALLFIFGMVSFIAALLFFLREVFLAIGSLRIGTRK